MAYPDFKKDFILHTDASESGIGAVLYQHQKSRAQTNSLCFTNADTS